MVHVAMALFLVTTGVGQQQPLEYEAAFSKAQHEKKPLLVVVGARWCAACQVLKKETVEPMKKKGDLDEVIITYVDKDERPELAQQLMQGETLPQIVVYTEKEKGKWKRFSLTGLQSESRLAELLGRALGRVAQPLLVR